MDDYTISKLAFDAGVSVRIVRAAFETGIGLRELTRLCHALVGGAGDADECLAHLRLLISSRLETLACGSTACADGWPGMPTS